MHLQTEAGGHEDLTGGSLGALLAGAGVLREVDINAASVARLAATPCRVLSDTRAEAYFTLAHRAAASLPSLLPLLGLW